MAEKMRAASQSGDGYWKQREDRQRENDIKDDKAIGREMNQIFNRAADNAAREIESFYGRYADKEGMSLADAMKPVTRSEMEEYQRLAKIYVEAAAARRRGEATTVDPFSDEANRAMRRYNMSMKVNRLEMLKARIGVANVDSYDRMREVIGSGLSRAAQQRYEYYAGILGKTVQNPEQAAQTLVNASYHNATWSDRIWANQERLRDRLGDALRTGLLQGKGAVALARDIRNAFGVSGYEAQRLMRTEMARVRIGAAEQSMQANGNTHYIYLAEPSACPDCAELADQVFPLPDMQPGSNAPPIHPFCRCAVAPHWDDDKYQRWLDDLASGGDTPWAEFEGEDGATDTAQYLVKSYNAGDNITKERMNINKVISSVPQKVQEAINAGTQIIVGKYSGSGYDYKNDILHIAKGATQEEIVHEIGHLIDNKLINQSARDSLLRDIVAGMSIEHVKQDVFVDASGQEHNVIYLQSDRFVSDYQGRVYVDEAADAFDDNGNVRIDKMQEFISEIFREYWKDSENLNRYYPEHYSLIDGAVK